MTALASTAAHAPDRTALRAAALRLLEEADRLGIGVNLSLYAGGCVSAPQVLVYGHYGDPTPLLARVGNVRWHEDDQGRYDANGAWVEHRVAFLNGQIDGVPVQWNGTPEQAARLRAALATQAPLETPAILADMSAQDALDTVASAG
mgnify:CR=1 FL=1